MAAKKSKTDWIDVDGSVLEGGGQILRLTIALSGVLSTKVRVHSIRASRSKPGLKAQHLTGLRLVETLYEGARLDGAAMNASNISFEPGSTVSKKRNFMADVKTAGATTLLAQISLPCLLYGKDWPTSLDLRGGTNAIMAPQIDYFRNVFMPLASRFGMDLKMVEHYRGYFPRGGGRIELEVNPLPANAALKPISMLDAGRITKIDIEASVGGTYPLGMAEEMAHAAKKVFTSKLSQVEIKDKAYRVAQATGNGASIHITAYSSTGCIFGGGGIAAPKKKPAMIACDAANELLQPLQLGACVDDYMQDQLLIFMALADGLSEIRTSPLTMHSRTAIHVCEMLLNTKYHVNTDDNGTCIIRCEGTGLKNNIRH